MPTEDQAANVKTPAAIPLVHGWDRVKNEHVYSLLGLSTHKKCEMLPNYDKVLMCGRLADLEWHRNGVQSDVRTSWEYLYGITFDTPFSSRRGPRS